eukprot:1095018-Karenia_brevis.AAC.1
MTRLDLHIQKILDGKGVKGKGKGKSNIAEKDKEVLAGMPNGYDINWGQMYNGKPISDCIEEAQKPKRKHTKKELAERKKRDKGSKNGKGPGGGQG